MSRDAFGLDGLLNRGQEGEGEKKEIKKGDIVTCRLTGIEDYGAFVRIIGDGRSGLIYYKEIPRGRRGKANIERALDGEEEFEAMVTEIKEKGKISLSIAKAEAMRSKEEVKRQLAEMSGEERSIRDIWDKIIRINKLLLQYMRLPIKLKPETCKIDEDTRRLTVNIDEESKVEAFTQSLYDKYGVKVVRESPTEWSFRANIDELASGGALQEMESDCESLYYMFVPQAYAEGRIYGYNRADEKMIEEIIRAYWPQIIILRRKRGEMVFRQPYEEHSKKKETYEYFVTMFEEIVKGCELESGGEEEKKGEATAGEMSEKPRETRKYKPIALRYTFEGQGDEVDKFYIKINEIDVMDQENAIGSALKNSEFSCQGVVIGKLLNFKYPKMVFGIEADNKEAVEKMVEEGKLMAVSADMSGETERISRLNEAYSFITNNPDQLRNPRFAVYLFDASKAKPIKRDRIEERKEAINDTRLNKDLNEWQVEAIAKAVEARDIALIQGPPGTGKSTAIAELAWQLALADPEKCILLTSEANLAVDNALDRLKFAEHNIVKPIRIGAGDRVSAEGMPYMLSELKKWARLELDYVQKEDDEELMESDEYKYYDPSNVVLARWMSNIYSRNQIADEGARRLWHDYLADLPMEERKAVYDAYIRGCNLIGATCSAICEKNYLSIEKKKTNTKSKFMKRYEAVFPKARRIEFDTVVQDEASKSTPAELSMPLIFGRKAVIIGDHRQLPPNLDRDDIIYKLHYEQLVSDDVKEKEEARELEDFVRNHFDELEKSHFERLYEQAYDSIKGGFRYQYRMHPDINDVIRQFYMRDGGLECGLTHPEDKGVDDEDVEGNRFSRYHGIDIEGLVSPDNHVVWIDTRTPELLYGNSRANMGEVRAVDWVLSKLATSPTFAAYNSRMKEGEEQEIGLITFYGAQLRQLSMITGKYAGDLRIKLSSVDRFQGMERNIIIVSLVRSDCIAENASQMPDYKTYRERGYRRQRDLGFAKSPNRLNVALSRAKRLLIIVGNSSHFSSYTNKKTGEAIYKNVYDTIRNNPHGRIVEWEDETSKPKMAPIDKNKSGNLNTRDIGVKDKHLRVMETWLATRVERGDAKIAVLELSTKAVKCLIGNSPETIRNATQFSFDNFIRMSEKTETGRGLDRQNTMDMGYFKGNVMPSIRKMKRLMIDNGVDLVYAVATAAYRTAKNRDEIIQTIKDKTGINVCILSKEEESVSTLYAYALSTSRKEELSASPHVVMIDQGGGSTEVSLFENTNLIDSYSINLGTTALRNNLYYNCEMETPIEDALRRSDKTLEERLRSLYKNINAGQLSDDNFCVSVGTAITAATGRRGNRHQHDRILTLQDIRNKIESCQEILTSQFGNVGELNYYDVNSKGGNRELDAVITMRLGLPMFPLLMERFHISRIHVSGTGLWYGIYLQHLFNPDETE